MDGIFILQQLVKRNGEFVIGIEGEGLDSD